VQEPTDPAILHAWHVPPHAVLQQTPSTQFPLPHWFAAVHATPFAFFAVQTLLAQ
jgi:hypothetical protein